MQDGDLISRAAVVKMLHEKAKSYSPSMFSTEGECYIAKVIAMEVSQEVSDMPAVDAEPVKRGEWQKEGGIPSCSVCHNEAETNHHDRFILSRYCPDCGAKMGGTE